MHETSDISVKSQLSTVVRSDRTANALLQHGLKVLGDLDYTGKLVMLTYDRAAVMAEEHDGLLRKHCKTATFIHCYAHKLNLVLSQSASFTNSLAEDYLTLPQLAGIFGVELLKLNEDREDLQTIFNL
ncbi:hypothetical protein ILUMI_26639 [Ignelater luminosus]|uniref:Uncharacterized protein n=1 Tax=Ignelater luminosus TaxID=2038154 RepID=A0A8K0C829_IGNLU|nr:hypothetical protein ILUMI_26639 [Ignelater luminosus]